MKVFVTVDDLGMAESVNSGARILLSEGVIDCLSIMATGPAVREAVELAGGSDTSVSVHLNCVQPPFLLGGDFPDSHFTWFRNGSKLAAKVEDEWRCQIENILSAGIAVTRLDSHQHIHNANGLREVILGLAEEYGIGAVRAAVLPDKWKSASGFILDRLGRKLAKEAAGRSISTPDLMLGFPQSGNVSLKYLESLEKHLERDGTAELVMHPATETVWVSTQIDELELMRSERFAKWLRKH